MPEFYQVKTTKKRRKKGARLKIMCFCFLLVFIAILIYYLNVVCPVVVSLSKDKIHAVATSSISEVVGEVLTDKEISYNSLVKISYSANNEVEVIEIDSVQVNLLIRDVTARVQQRFDRMKGDGIGIALGTFTGIPFLYGLGPDISVQLVPVGMVKTRIVSQFNSAGINQTLHRLNFVVSANIGMVLPANTQNITTDLEVMICESVIVGKIPSVYLQGQLF